MSKFKVVPTPDHGTRLVPVDPTPPGSHTPGPWIAGNSRGGRIYNRWGIYRFGARKVAVVCENNSPEIEHANARLIAAAPELLEVLQELVDASRNVQECWTSGDLAGAVNALGTAMADAERTIAKATGH